MKNTIALLSLAVLMLGYTGVTQASGCPDGSDPVKSISADGSYYVYNCASTNSSVTGNTTAVAGIDIENDPTKEFYSAPVAGFRPFMHKEEWRTQDFNNDGYAEV